MRKRTASERLADRAKASTTAELRIDVARKRWARLPLFNVELCAQDETFGDYEGSSVEEGWREQE